MRRPNAKQFDCGHQYEECYTEDFNDWGIVTVYKCKKCGFESERVREKYPWERRGTPNGEKSTSLNRSSTVEVIGNKWDNPELLEVK